MKPIVLIAVAAALGLACDVKNPSGPFTGTIVGTIASSKGPPLANVLFTRDPGDTTRSRADGTWKFVNVPVGTGSILVDSLSLPAGCASVPPFTYIVQQTGTTTRFALVVTC